MGRESSGGGKGSGRVMRERRSLKTHETIHAATDLISRGVLECLGDASRGQWCKIKAPYQGRMPRALAPSGMAVGALFPKGNDGNPKPDDISGMVGYYQRDAHHYQFLKGHAALANKLLVGLTHEYRTPEYNLRQHISLPDLMDLLRFKRNTRGEHETRSRRLVVQALEALSRIEVIVFVREGRTYNTLSGPVWVIDPLGADGTPMDGWDGVRAIRMRPEALTHYTYYDQHIYRLCQDYLSLPTGNTGRQAVFLGTYLIHLTAIAATKGLKSKTCRIDTLERWAGIDGSEKDPTRRVEVLKRTLELLKHCHVVHDWTDDCETGHIRIAFQLADMPRPKRQHPFRDYVVEEPERTTIPECMRWLDGADEVTLGFPDP